MIRSLEESTGGNRNMRIIMEFNDTINHLNLIEVPLAGRSFTWSSKRPTPTFTRLDRAFISSEWTMTGVIYGLTDLPCTASDHVPLLLTIKLHAQPKGQWHFENFWLMHSEVKDVVQTAWDIPCVHQNKARKFQFRLRNTMEALIKWSQQKFGSRNSFMQKSKWVLQCIDRVEEKRMLTQIEIVLRIRIREHIFKMAKEKEAKWKQRSGAQWLRLGEKILSIFMQSRMKEKTEIT